MQMIDRSDELKIANHPNLSPNVIVLNSIHSKHKSLERVMEAKGDIFFCNQQ
jgi:hypothetical protein